MTTLLGRWRWGRNFAVTTICQMPSIKPRLKPSRFSGFILCVTLIIQQNEIPCLGYSCGFRRRA